MTHVRSWLVFVSITLLGGLARADEELQRLGTVQDIVFFAALNEPYQGCYYGAIHNAGDHEVSVEWQVSMTSEDGATADAREGYILRPGQKLGGWAAISACPFNQLDGSPSSRMTHIEISGVTIVDLDEERDAAEREQEAADREREEQEERDAAEDQQRLEDERRRAEEETEIARQEELREEYREQVAVADEENAERVEAIASVLGALDGKTNLAGSGLTMLTHFGVGLAGSMFPLYTNWDATQDVEAGSGDYAAGGLGLGLEADIWPVFTPYGGFALHGDVFGVGFAVPGGNVGAVGGSLRLRGMVGKAAAVSLLADLGVGARAGTASYNAGAGLIDQHETGSAGYRYYRAGGGLRICTGRQRSYDDTVPVDTRYCASGIDLTVRIELPDYRATTTAIPRVFELEWWTNGSLGLRAHAGKDYPIAGAPLHEVENTTEWIGGLDVVFAYDHYRSLGRRVPSRAELDARKAEVDEAQSVQQPDQERSARFVSDPDQEVDEERPPEVTLTEGSGAGRSPGRGLRIGGLAIAGLGVALLAGGIGYGLVASDASDTVSGAMGAWTTALDAEVARGESARTRAVVFSITGAIAATTGVVLYLRGRR